MVPVVQNQKWKWRLYTKKSAYIMQQSDIECKNIEGKNCEEHRVDSAQIHP